MSSKRRPTQADPRMNYRPASDRNEVKGTKPTIAQTSIQEIFVLMLLFCCKKILFYNTKHRVFVYLGCLFLLSLIADVANMPKSYLSRSDNIFNQYFVKYAWGWNLLLVVPYVTLSSYVYCCGEKERIVKHHLSRVAVATGFWYFWTSLFNYVECTYGKCNIKSAELNSKSACLKSGNFWNGFDISGHSFILIYGSLLLLEETRSIANWDSIKDYIRLDEHYRATQDTALSTNPLRVLRQDQFAVLQSSYDKYTPYIRLLFVLMTGFSILWDSMLLSTMLYYHVMVEKLLGGLVAILTWFITYRMWYSQNGLIKLPGDGHFRYIKQPRPAASSSNAGISRRRTGSIVNGTQATFMGRPLYSCRSDPNASDIEEPMR